MLMTSNTSGLTSRQTFYFCAGAQMLRRPQRSPHKPEAPELECIDKRAGQLAAGVGSGPVAGGLAHALKHALLQPGVAAEQAAINVRAVTSESLLCLISQYVCLKNYSWLPPSCGRTRLVPRKTAAYTNLSLCAFH